MLTAHKQSRYLCLFHHQSVGPSKQAQRMAREAGAMVLSLRHHAGMEVMASAREAERLSDFAVHSAVFTDAMKRETRQGSAETQQRLVAVWNARFGKRFKNARQAARQHIGKSWADPTCRPRRPFPIWTIVACARCCSPTQSASASQYRVGAGQAAVSDHYCRRIQEVRSRLLGKLKDRKSAHELAIAAAKWSVGGPGSGSAGHH